MISSSVKDDSEATLLESVHKLACAGGSIIQVRTRETLRAAIALRRNLIGSEHQYREWDVVNGFRTFTKENLADHRVSGGGEDFMQAMMKPLEEIRLPTSRVNAEPDKIHYFVYVDPHPFIANNPLIHELLQQYAALLPSTTVCTILVTPHVNLSDLPTGTVLITDMPTPTATELQRKLHNVLQDAGEDFEGGIELEDDDCAKVANMGLGLSLYEFETYAAIAIIDASRAGETSITYERLLSGVAEGKTAVIKQSEILELMSTEDMGNVGGMNRLKRWISARADCYSEDAKAFGIESPKGLVLVGVPGTGKSLAAKAIASVLEVPLVRLDIARVFSKYVGDSESRIAAALKMVESMSPVVLFVDEIDKALGGASGGGDSGTSSRVLGTFLTWLQDCKSPVFTVVTANRVDGLPPELLRRGRFDQIFSVSMPSPEERREVLDIHLRKRGRELGQFNEAEIAQFLERSEKYVPAEIESAVKDALVMAFNDNKAKDLEMGHLLDALGALVPMSKSHADAIDRIMAWAQNNATPVSDPPSIALGTTGGARVLRPGRR